MTADTETKLNRLITHIRKGDVKFVIGIEIDGDRHFMKSDFSASLIGFCYRSALKEERPQELSSQVLPFPEFWESVKTRNEVRK
ncbi:MAG: hypothetical protein KAW12_06190 [Candidatus Aminicenantes bacterium]|nr:hypothetical protein [Candidatus Aminicenantes bacterium]